MHELHDPQPGGFLIAQHLAHMMLVQALRLHLAEGPQGGVGWLFALADGVGGQEKGEGSVKLEAFIERVKGLIESKSSTLELAPDWKKLRGAAADGDRMKDFEEFRKEEREREDRHS